jgi:hypothetical protein
MHTCRLLAVLSLLAALASAGSVNPAWIKHYTGPTQSQFNEAADSYLDTLTGNLYVVGAGELSTNPDGTDLVVMKYRPDGTRAWVNGFSGTGSSSEDMAQAVAVDSVGNVYIAGRADNTDFDDAAWAKYDSNGVELWHRSSGLAGNDEAFGIAVGNAGDVYICGSDSGYGYLTGYLVARINPTNGDTLWTRSYVLDTNAFARRNQGQDLHPDYFDDYDLYDNAAVAIARSPDSGVVTTGHGLDLDLGFEWWTMKFRPNGDTLWTRTYHNPNTSYDDDDVAFDLAVANSGDIYAVGFDYYERSNSQGYNFAVVRYNSTGTRLNWNSIDVAAQHGDDYAFSVALDDSSPQNVYVTGTLEYPSPLLEQISTMKFNNTLTSRWGPAGATYGSDGNDLGYSVFYRKGRVYVTGLNVNDLVALGYTAANASPKDTAWTYRYDDPDQMIDFGSTVCASDSDHVFISGEASHAGAWTSLYTARLRYGHPDMAVASIVAPQGTYDHYDTVIPRVSIHNYGDIIPAFNAFMYIGLPYGDTVRVYDGPAPGQSAVVSFKPWPAHPTGLVPLRCSLEVEGDTNPGNDFLSDTVQVLPIDVGCRLILSPVGTIDSGSTATPLARFKNFGTSTQTFAVWFRIETTDSAATGLPQRRTAGAPLQVYQDSATVTIAPQESADVSFNDWQASPPDTFSMKAFTALYGDDNQSNDTVSAQLIVGPGPGIQSPENLSGVPREYSLGSPRPNPFVGQMLVPFALPARSRVSLRVYDAAGVLVRTLTAAELPAGFYHVGWDGKDGRGQRVKAGTYFCRLQAQGYTRIAKLIMSD